MESTTGYAPFLNEMQRLRIEDELSQRLHEQNPEASEDRVREASEKLSELIAPLVTEVDVPGGIQSFRFSADMGFLHLDYEHKRVEVEEK